MSDPRIEESCNKCENKKLWKSTVHSDGLGTVVMPPKCKECIQIVHKNFVPATEEEEEWVEVRKRPGAKK